VKRGPSDFGTGTSSLGLLRDFPFDTIKIDRSLVQDLIPNRDVLEVTHATIAMIDISTWPPSCERAACSDACDWLSAARRVDPWIAA
jgi:EAL domain-containing protein (putative c-di-GMP-specific phosphodiesterase class I)